MSQDVTESVSAKAPVFVDINNEEYRVYEFPNGSQVTIYAPVKLNVKRSAGGDSHRIISEDGMSHYIPAGWNHLQWKGKNGKSEYSF